MSTKGNTGQSSDSMGPLGKPSDWHGAGMGTPGYRLSTGGASSKGLRGFGSNKGLGEATTMKTPSPGSDALPRKPKDI